MKEYSLKREGDNYERVLSSSRAVYRGMIGTEEKALKSAWSGKAWASLRKNKWELAWARKGIVRG